MRSATLVMVRWVVGTAWLAGALMQTIPAHGDEPGRLGRLFRLGSATSEPAKPAGAPASGAARGSSFGLGSAVPGSTSTPAATYRPVNDPYGQPALSTPPTTPIGAGGSTPLPRITPKPRVNKAVTEADPLVSRISLGRADGGSQFGMFLQVFADGTVIDGEGVHKVGPDALKPVVEAVGSGEFAKLKGHCGGPAGDTFETIHVVTFERAYGRLRANSFSYSGNPQGCDHAVHHLHKVLDDLQMKLSVPGASGAPAAALTPVVVTPPMTTLAPMAPGAGAAPAPVLNQLTMPSLPDPGLH